MDQSEEFKGFVIRTAKTLQAGISAGADIVTSSVIVIKVYNGFYGRYNLLIHMCNSIETCKFRLMAPAASDALTGYGGDTIYFLRSH